MTPFKRFYQLMALAAAAIAATPGLTQAQAIGGLGGYRSHPKDRHSGGNRVAPGRGMAAHRAAVKARNKR